MTHPPLSIFNWSLKKLLATQPDALAKAKAKILFWILILSLTKIIVGITVSWYAGQDFQLVRAIIILGIYTMLLKALLANKEYLKPITHIMICMGVLLIWSNVFLYVHTINVITVQFIAMLILSSYYLLTERAAFFYCVLCLVPVALQLVFKEQLSLNFISANEIASPGYEIIIILNFITIVLSHYLFKQAFVNNLAEKEALNLQLKVAVQEANLAAESKSDFLSTMSHELRTPLNAVIGISELLLSREHTKEQEENLSILKFSAGNLHALINDILDFNKLGSGKLALETIPVNLYKLMHELSLSLNFQAGQKGVAFVLDIDEAVHNYRVITDPTRITQIIYNLAGNAIKFTSEGRVTLGVKILNTNNDTLTAKIFVSDTGIGISKEKQEVIFEPFIQGSSSTTRNFGGTGLGLAIVKQLLFLFNSTIKVESTPGIGSTFSFELILPFSEEPQVNTLSGAERNYDLNGLRILVAEDYPINRLLLSKIFLNWNVKVAFALTGQEAVEKLIEEDFDVILMDLHMPVMDGYEATRVIRSLPETAKSGIKIIALTASVSGDLNEKIKGTGMDGFILKPFKMNELYACLKEDIKNMV